MLKKNGLHAPLTLLCTTVTQLFSGGSKKVEWHKFYQSSTLSHFLIRIPYTLPTIHTTQILPTTNPLAISAIILHAKKSTCRSPTKSDSQLSARAQLNATISTTSNLHHNPTRKKSTYRSPTKYNPTKYDSQLSARTTIRTCTTDRNHTNIHHNPASKKSTYRYPTKSDSQLSTTINTHNYPHVHNQNATIPNTSNSFWRFQN